MLLVAVPLMNFHPLVWGIVADKLISGSLTSSSLAFWLAVMLFTYLVGVVVNAIHTYLLEKAGQAFVRDIRVELFAKFEHQSLAYHHDTHSGELVTRIISDVDAMEQSVLQGLTSLLGELVTFVVVAGMVLWISPLVGSVSILPLAVSFIFIRMYNRRVKSIYSGVRSRLGKIGSFVQDRLTGVQETQAYGQQGAEERAFAKKANAFYEASIKASKLRQIYFPIVSVFGFINNIIMLGVGAWLIMNQSTAFTIGGLLAYRGFWWRLQSPIRTIAQTSDILQRARASAARVFEIMQAPVAIIDTPNAQLLPKPVRGSVKLENLSFHYVSQKPILTDINLTIHPGEFVAIAGSSGSGKTTLLNLIPRYFDVTGGQLLVDDIDVRNVQLGSLRETIGLVGQESYLFDGTVRENLLYAKPNANETELVAAARGANASGFINGLPNGYDTHVGQNGVKLSGGQRQRLSLARALLSKPTLLLLDEPTASVEPESESLIRDSILHRTRASEGTTILVTHRIDLLSQSPRILFFDEGQLADDGSHEQLVTRCSAYKNAYQQWEREETVH